MSRELEIPAVKCFPSPRNNQNTQIILEGMYREGGVKLYGLRINSNRLRQKSVIFEGIV